MPTSLLSTGVQFPDNSVQGIASDYIMRVYTSPATWTKPTGLKAVKVTVIGGGGSGGFSTPHMAGGGAGGVAIRYVSSPSIPGPVTVTVGAGGAGLPFPPNSGRNGNAGGTSSFGAFASATGGGGGFASSPFATGGAGGAGSGGDINWTGGRGGSSSDLNVGTGAGGGTNSRAQPAFNVVQGYNNITSLSSAGAGMFGYGGLTGPFVPGPEKNATGFGNGGAGISGGTSSGAGSGGVIIVEEFY